MDTKVRLYVVYPILPDGEGEKPTLYSAEFTDKGKTYRINRKAYPSEETCSAFGWRTAIDKQSIEYGLQLKYGGFPALTPQAAEEVWRRRLKGKRQGHLGEADRIQNALDVGVVW